jgi:DNA-binding MarR family transcriptional regulator
LESVGISALREWDTLIFVYRHGLSLTSAARIAQLVGYESASVSSALDRLEREKLIEYSRSSHGVRLYRIVASSADAERLRCFQELINVSQSRAGRLLLAKRLRSVTSELA